MKVNLPKNCLRLFLVLFVPINALLAQTWQTPIQAGGKYLSTSINSVYFTSATQGWAVGNSGMILVTSDGGTNWTPQTSGTVQPLLGVYFITAAQGWAVGAGGTILATSNGGTTWTAQTPSVSGLFYNVYFTSATQGWVVGFAGTILVTSNGGTTWTAQSSGNSNTLQNVKFTSATQGWAVGNVGMILVTSDGGTTWTAQTSGTTSQLNGLNFTSSTQGWVVGASGNISVTNNGGTTWTAQTSGTSQSLNSVYFTSATQGWAVGNAGTILVTSNGGTTWTAQTSGTTVALNEVYFTSNSQGTAVGTDGTILVTSNGGTTWTYQTFGTSQNLFSVKFISSTKGWAVGTGGKILGTSDGGLNWSAQTSGTTNILYDVCFTSASQGWVVGATGTILVTSNGGTTWTSQPSGTTQVLSSVNFISATQGWVVGNNGTIRVTSNGGSTWTTQTSGTTTSLNSVYFASATQGWAAGSNGTILVTSNGGSTWSAQTSGTTEELYGLNFISASQGWAVGSNGTILVTSNGGTTWTAQTSGTTIALYGLYFKSATQGWAVSSNGTILVTSNGGTTWTAQTSGTTNALNSIYFTSPTQGWAVGSGGTILIYGAVAPVSSIPTVSTSKSLSIATTSATLGGNVSDSGTAAVSERGIVYATTANPTTLHTKVQMGAGIGTYSQNVTGLSANTTYHVRAYAINSVGTAYGADSTFTTLAVSNEVPQTITGLQLWLDASDVNNTGSNPANSTPISTWKDRSGFGNDASVLSGQNPGILSTNQINGKSVVKFNRTSSVLGSVYNVPNVDIRAQNMPKITIFTVYKQGAQTSPVADQAIWGCDDGGWDRFFFSSFPSYTGGGNNPDNGGVSQGTYANVVNNAGLLNKTQLLTAVYDNQTNLGSGVYFNGQNIATFTDVTTLTDAKTSLRIGFDGDDNCYNGDIAEMMVYNRKLTDCEIQTINKYLSNKYGVAFTSVSIDTSGPTTFNVGDSVVLSSSVTASSYKWLKNGSVISGAVSKNYAAKQSGNYQVIATNSCSDTSSVKVVTVISNNPPKTISGLQLWLDASDINNNGSNPNNGTSITTWKDRSGAGNDASVLAGQNAGVLSTNQINGKSVVNFTRTGNASGSVYDVPDLDIRPLATPKMTIFTVYKQGAQDGSNQGVWGCDNGGWDRFFFSSFPSGMQTPNDGGVAQGTYANRVVGAGIVGKTRLLTAVYDYLVPQGSAVYFNGNTIATFGDSTNISNAQSSLRIGFDGDDNPFNGDIAEMIVYNRKLTYCEILTINKYLGDKYGQSFASVGIDTSGPTTFRFGDSVVLSSNTNAASYQWLRNGSPISGAMSKSYVSKQAGDYQVVVLSACSDTSAVKQVSIITTPLVKTTSVSNLTINSATLSGNVIDSGSASVIERGVVYATTINPTIANSKVIVGAGLGSFSKNVLGLLIGTTYHVRAYATNSFGTTYGADSTFTTLASATLPTIITQKPTLITFNSAVMGGNITSNGGANVTERGFVYNTFANPDTASGIVRKVGFNVGNYGNNISTLTPATKYHVRAYAINSVGIVYGGDSVFTTLPAIPKVNTSPAIVVTTNSATLGGNVVDTVMANVTERGVVYSTIANPSTSDTKIVIGSGLGVFSQNVTGLNPATTYHVRAYAINAAGTSYGADTIFTTLTTIKLASVITLSPLFITSSSAKLGGDITSDGGTSITERGIVYSININPSTSDNKVTFGSGTGGFGQVVSGLTSSTTYHVRAYAINNVGTSYGADSSFTTLAEPATIDKIVNAFSPNGDGLNDTWEIENAADLKDHVIIVYNIFGQEVFSQTGYDIPWDGKVDGNPVPSAEYYYLIKGPKVNKRGALLIKNN